MWKCDYVDEWEKNQHQKKKYWWKCDENSTYKEKQNVFEVPMWG